MKRIIEEVSGSGRSEASRWPLSKVHKGYREEGLSEGIECLSMPSRR